MEKLFETATRKKYRFPYRGMIGVEDLWDLTPAALDTVYKSLNKTAQAQSEDSLMTDKEVDPTTANMIEIVRYIFTVKRDEAKAREAQVENAKKRKHIMEIIARKQDEALSSLSEEELTRMLDEL